MSFGGFGPLGGSALADLPHGGGGVVFTLSLGTGIFTLAGQAIADPPPATSPPGGGKDELPGKKLRKEWAPDRKKQPVFRPLEASELPPLPKEWQRYVKPATDQPAFTAIQAEQRDIADALTIVKMLVEADLV